MDVTEWIPKFPSKYDQAKGLSKLSFDWIRKTLWNSYKGRKLDIGTDDAPQELKAKTLREYFTKKTETKEKSNQTLLSLFSRLYFFYCILTSTLSFIRFTVLVLIQAYFMGLLIGSLRESAPSDLLWLDRYVSAGVIITISLISVVLLSQTSFLNEKLGAKIRIISSSLVYEKLLRIPSAEMKIVNIGHIINLFASDVSKFDDCAKLTCSRLFDPLAVLANLVFLQQMAGTPSVIGYIILALTGISLTFLSKIFKKFGRERAVLTDQRLKLTTDMITETRTMKMFCWEELYCKSIAEIRKKEMKLSFIKFCCKAIVLLFQSVSARISMYVTVMLMIFMSHQIKVSTVYMCFAVFNMTQVNLIILVSKMVEASAYALVSFERIQKILIINEISNNKIHRENGPPTLQDVTSSWNPSLDNQNNKKFTLKTINAIFPYSTITMVTGSVGSGKSSLLLTIANELFIHSGKIITGGSLTYLPQEPWLFPSTIRQNILFGLPLDEQRYQHILASCALDHDISDFPNGDSSNVDDKGLTLSGGQKARIALARAMYRDSDVYLLDDPLSAVDVKVGSHIWKNFEASNKTIILVSHAVHLLKNRSFIVYMKEGQMISGNYEKLKGQLQMTSASDNVDFNIEDHKKINIGEKKNSNILPTNQLQDEFEKSVTRHPNLLMLWCKMAWNFANGYGIIVLMAFLSIAGQAFGTLFDIFLSRWVYAQKMPTNETVNAVQDQTFLLYLGFLLLGEILFSIARNMIFFLLSINAALKLHNIMLKAVTKTKMSFFDSHQTGQIINRFSKDVEYVDDTIATLTCLLLRIFSAMLGVIANAIYSNYLVSIPIAIFFIVVGCLISVFRKASKHFSQIEASARSPIYSYMNCSVNGIVVIRSHENQEKMIKEFDIRQDRYSAIWVLMKGMSYWVTILCELSGNLQLICVILLTLLLPNLTNSSRLGIGISSTIILGGLLQVFMKECVDLDNLIVSIERMVEYTMLQPEEASDNSKKSLSKDWPKLGQITVKNLNLYYGKNNKKVLDDITFDIKPTEKIGIVGRTGAGKSSLIAALFQMANMDGQILIDKVDITTLNLSEYRKKLSIIPQNPVLLSGSIRRNLDPSNEFSDEELWSALDEVKLKDVIKNLPKAMEDSMNQFSVGQKQLFCLARTLLYKRKIIVFDEATSNIDNKTDEMMQELIRTKFSNSTILVIAHRLQTVMDLDRIMVLHQGEITEFDCPAALMNNPNSMFRQMVLNAKIDYSSFVNKRRKSGSSPN